MKKIIMAVILSMIAIPLTFAATLDTGYILNGVNGMNAIMMSGGQMVTVWNGGSYTMKMINDVTLGNGTMVRPDGSMVMANGSTSWMKNGEELDLQGNIMNGGSNTSTAPSYSSSGTLGMRTVIVNLNVRSGPGIGYARIGYLNAGSQVDVKSKSPSGYWCSMNYKNYSSAWVACRYLAR